MPDVAGRVADEFEARIREHEESWLSPLAVRSYSTVGRALEDATDRRYVGRTAGVGKEGDE